MAMLASHTWSQNWLNTYCYCVRENPKQFSFKSVHVIVGDYCGFSCFLLKRLHPIEAVKSNFRMNCLLSADGTFIPTWTCLDLPADTCQLPACSC